MNSKLRINWINRIFRALAKPVFRLIFFMLSPIKLSGLENVPKSGPYLIVFNHVSIFDAPFLVAFWPGTMEVLGADDVWNRAGQNLLARFWGGIPIRRGEIDRGAMEGMLMALRAGRPLLIAPEGGRSHQPGMRQAKAGIVYLVERTNVPVVPVGILGATPDYFQRAKQLKRPPLEMRVGKPFKVPECNDPELNPKDARQWKADAIMEKIAELLPPEYQGVYARSEVTLRN
jgi:1-acyl-sn-glycerol-3-phosphate acyltransferase